MKKKSKIIGKEQPSEFYDKAYNKPNTIYDVADYKKSVYYPVWREIINSIDERNLKQSNVLDLGCGVGHFAKMLFNNNIFIYNGIDFSKVAIEKAKEYNSEEVDDMTKCISFTQADLLNSQKLLSELNYNLVFCLEVLEHIEEDLLVLSLIQKGSTLIFTVPDFPSKSHVRHFKSRKEVISRYKNHLDFDYYKKSCIEFKLKNLKFFICKTIVK